MLHSVLIGNYLTGDGMYTQEGAQRKDVKGVMQGPVGVGGWLMFFSVIMVARALAGYGNVYGALKDIERSLASSSIQLARWGEFKFAFLSLFAASTFMSLLAVYWLFKRKNPTTVRAVIVVLWVTGPLVEILSALILSFYFGSYFVTQNIVGSLVGGVAGSSIFAGFWTLYFLKSKRVRNTYYEYFPQRTREKGESKLSGFFSGALLLAWIVFLFGLAIFQMVYGFKGIEYGLGFWWAVAALLVSIFLRFTIPLTIGTFYYLYVFEGWNVLLALLVAIPGLIFIVPGVVGVMVDAVKRRWS